MTNQLPFHLFLLLYVNIFYAFSVVIIIVKIQFENDYVEEE